MKGEGCGGHGKDDAGVWVRDDSCDWCQRHDWSIEPSQSISDLQEAIHDRFCLNPPTLDDDGWYDHMKEDWRRTCHVIEVWLSKGWTPAKAPEHCATCGAPPLDRIHTDCYDTRTKGPCQEGQHPFEMPTYPRRWQYPAGAGSS